jgi:cell division protein FtsW (lipid II flippase)
MIFFFNDSDDWHLHRDVHCYQDCIATIWMCVIIIIMLFLHGITMLIIVITMLISSIITMPLSPCRCLEWNSHHNVYQYRYDDHHDANNNNATNNSQVM